MLYEFKTVGRNDYPDDSNVNSRSESPASDVTEGRPLPSTTSKYRTSLSEENATIGDKINRLFYRYGGRIELIRFEEYYRMPRGHENISFVFSSAFRDIFS